TVLLLSPFGGFAVTRAFSRSFRQNSSSFFSAGSYSSRKAFLAAVGAAGRWGGGGGTMNAEYNSANAAIDIMHPPPASFYPSILRNKSYARRVHRAEELSYH